MKALVYKMRCFKYLIFSLRLQKIKLISLYLSHFFQDSLFERQTYFRKSGKISLKIFQCTNGLTYFVTVSFTTKKLSAV